MAKRIVSHKPTKCKVNVNPKLEATAESLKTSPELRYRRAGEALSLTNEEAIEFLRSVGFAQIVPGTHFAPERDYAKFFDLQWHIFHGYVYRYKLGSEHNPDESFSTTPKNLFRIAGLLDKGEIVPKTHKSDPFDFYFKNTDSHYVTQDSSSVRFVSARTAVALIPIMAHYNGMFSKERCRVLDNELSKFMHRKHEREMAIIEAEAAARVAAEAEAKKEAEVKAVLAEETLYQLIKRAVTEVMSGAKFSLAAPAENT